MELRETLIIVTFVAFILDFGTAAYIRSTRPKRTHRHYELYSCIANVAVFGAWLLFGDLSLVIQWAVGIYAFLQALGVASCATELGESKELKKDE